MGNLQNEQNKKPNVTDRQNEFDATLSISLESSEAGTKGPLVTEKH